MNKIIALLLTTGVVLAQGSLLVHSAQASPRDYHINVGPWFNPIVLGPELIVNTQKNQLGAELNIQGKNFTRGGSVELYADGLVGRTAPLSLGRSTASSNDGSFKHFWGARCWSGQFDAVTIRAVDRQTGKTATGSTYGFSCR